MEIVIFFPVESHGPIDQLYLKSNMCILDAF